MIVNVISTFELKYHMKHDIIFFSHWLIENNGKKLTMMQWEKKGDQIQMNVIHFQSVQFKEIFELDQLHWDIYRYLQTCTWKTGLKQGGCVDLPSNSQKVNYPQRSSFPSKQAKVDLVLQPVSLHTLEILLTIMNRSCMILHILC